MMLTIHGLPSVANYQDVRTLLQRECNLSDFILDNLINDKHDTKKVRIGVADEMEGAHVIKCLDGFRCGGKVLFVVPVGKSQGASAIQQPPFNPQGNFQGNDYPVQGNFGPQETMGQGPGPWNSDQWAPNQQQMGGFNYPQQNVPYQQQQHPQRPLNQRELMLQSARGPVADNYDGRSGTVKQNVVPPPTRPALRNIETVDLPKPGPDRFQTYDQPKPITIKKDNFMGPNQFSGPNAQGPYPPNQGAWGNQGPPHKQGFGKPNQPFEDDKKFPPKAGILKTPQNLRPNDDRMPIGNDRRGPNDRRIDDRMGPNDRRIDDRIGPNDRRIDDRMGPNDRRIDERMGPNDRRINDDRMGPNDRRINDERMGPNDRRIIDERMGPNDRRINDRSGPNDRRMDDRMGPNDRRMNDNRGGPNDRRIDDRIGPNDRRINDERMGPNDRRINNDRGPNDHRMIPKDDRMGPPSRRLSPVNRDRPMGRHNSPPRRVSPGRRMSPGRRLSPGRRVSPPGGRMSPGRRLSPSGRRLSPSGRRISPSKRISPGRRMRSPNRRVSPDPHARRYSPSRLPDKDRLKQVRPAYEPDDKAANQAMYSGGFRPNAHEPMPYRALVPGSERSAPWPEQSRDKYIKKEEDPRRDVIDKRISPRASRSPHRHRSPVRDRYRRHSPSPRSPRRSWALEKRRSPQPSPHDAPPPPAWPGQSREDFRNHPEKSDTSPVWEKPFAKVKDEFDQDAIRVRKDLIQPRDEPRREPSPHRFKQERDDRYREPKFERDDYHGRRFEPDRKNLPDREEFIARSERAHQQFKKKPDSPQRQLPRLDQYRKKHEQIDEEFQDIYQRAVNFAKKSQELRKHERGKDEERPDRRHDGGHFFDRHEDRPRSRHSDDYRKREPEWDLDPRKRMDPNNLAKREKAVEEISRRIIAKYIHQVEPEMRPKVIDEIKEIIFNKIYEMYEDKDISYIECIIKFNTRFDTRAEEVIFHDAASKYSAQYRGTKRPIAAPSDIPTKMARRSPPSDLKAGTSNKPSGTIVSDWRANTVQMAVQQIYNAQQTPMVMNQFVPTMPTYQPPPPVPPVSQVYQPSEVPLQDDKDGYHLYLCKDNFNLFLGSDVNDLKEFLVSQIFNVTATHNWAPSFIFRGLQTPYRFEMITQDRNAKDWLAALDFSAFSKFNVLVYTSEELWYERLAIWLPGHSKCRYIDPFTKLQLQNRKVEGVDIGKWKFVRQIVTAKGTRLYVDVPPSVARALESKKTLSYELQQVNVFSKAMAVDKTAFDAGLNEKSIEDNTVIQNAIRNAPIPTLNKELDFVKITIKGYKSLAVADARKIKDMLIFELFKYLRLGGKSNTDFIRFGLSLPCYFGVVPANEESKKWLTQLNLGNLYRRQIVVIGGEDQYVKRIPLKAVIHCCTARKNVAYLFERLKKSNKGVKGLHFNLWKPGKFNWNDTETQLWFMIDMESVETLASLKFSLDYLDEFCDNDVKTVTFESEQGQEGILGMVADYKAERSDSYVVSNMDIASSETDDDIICLGEATDPEDDVEDLILE